MPSPIITLDLITSAMRLNGSLASGEVPTASEANDGLLVLNDMLENWSTEKLTVWQSANESFAMVPGQTTYTIGAGGNFNTVRPVNISAAYNTFGGVDFPIELVTQEDYNLINLKSMQQPVVEKLLYVNDYPLGLITLWPVPNQAGPLVLSTDRVLAFPVTLATSLSGPPGYLKALRFCLAIEFAAEFGIEVLPTVQQVAADAKADFKRANIAAVTMRCDDALVNPPVALYQRGY